MADQRGGVQSPDGRSSPRAARTAPSGFGTGRRARTPALRAQHAARVAAWRSAGMGMAGLGSWDRTIKVWETSTWELLHDLPDPTGAARAWRSALTAGWSGAAPTAPSRFGTGPGTETHVLRGHTSWVQAVAVSPDGDWIASASLGRDREDLAGPAGTERRVDHTEFTERGAMSRAPFLYGLASQSASSPHSIHECISCRSYPPACPFTLVELLVVIAIIGVLIALLCPRCRRPAKRRGEPTARTTQANRPGLPPASRHLRHVPSGLGQAPGHVPQGGRSSRVGTGRFLFPAYLKSRIARRPLPLGQAFPRPGEPAGRDYAVERPTVSVG